ncbi:MAG: HD-GYP domain-containing protein [Actinomycetota bacterium]
MAHPPGELGEEAVIARVGDVIADAATEGRRTAGEDARQAARRVAIGIATGMLTASRPEIAAHSDDVHIVAGAMARWLGLSGQRLEDVLVAARLHDIGKLAIPAGLLGKQTPLDPIEWVAIRRHTIVGEQILVSVPELRGAARLVRHSHERWDGFGYPDGLSGEEIPLGSRIISCADAFAVIRSDRSYRPGSSTAEALAEIHACAGTHFDPAVVEALEALAGGLRIAADRLRLQSGRASRLFALLLIVGVGASASALARSGLIPDAKPPHAAPAAVAGPRTSSATGSGGLAQSAASAPAPTGRPAGVPGLAGAAGATGSPSRLTLLAYGLGFPSAMVANPDNGDVPAGGTGSPGGEGQPGVPDHGQGEGHGKGQGKGHGQAPGQGHQTAEQTQGGENGSAGHGNGAGTGQGTSKVKQPKPAKPGKSSHTIQTPDQSPSSAAPGNGNGNGGNGNGNGNPDAGGNGNPDAGGNGNGGGNGKGQG